VSLELWEKSSEDVRERWRDIARILRNADDAEEIPRALQTCFWFGFQAGRALESPRTEGSLLNLLPPELAAHLLKSPVKLDPTPDQRQTRRRDRRGRSIDR